MEVKGENPRTLDKWFQVMGKSVLREVQLTLASP